jgi:cell division control protein 6
VKCIGCKWRSASLFVLGWQSDFMNENRIIKNIEVLEEDHVPASLLGRDRQIQELKLCLAPAVRRRRPINAWLYGRPGTGKTAVTKFVLEQLIEQTGVQGIYVNCWEHDSLYAIGDKLVRDLRIMFAERPDTTLKLERFQRAIGNKPFVIVLDEIDKPLSKERNATLYNLADIGNVGLVCICNSRYFLLSLDERVHSRLSPRQIGFSPYLLKELISILEQRAEVALEGNCWTKGMLEKIAELSEGDARIAIQTLRKAAELAESSNSNRILDEHVNVAWSSTKELKKKYLLEALSEHHKLIYGIIGEKPGNSSGKIWETYIKACADTGRKPIATRTFSAYLSKLIELKLISAEYAGRNVRIFRVI